MYRRGAVWTADIPDVGRKPVVIVSSRLVTLKLQPIVARITSTQRTRTIETVVALDAGEVDELPLDSFVLAHELFTLSDGALVEHLGALQPERMMDVDAAMLVALGLADEL
jgi:mRNA-degrading endonuclease toxin of MazEF toxin-antitoxin module